MYLHPEQRAWYSITVTSAPPEDAPTQAEARFTPDGTWVPGQQVAGVPGRFRWLLAGPAYQPAPADTDAFTVVPATYAPRIAFPAAPEREVEPGPLIILTPA